MPSLTLTIQIQLYSLAIRSFGGGHKKVSSFTCTWLYIVYFSLWCLWKLQDSLINNETETTYKVLTKTTNKFLVAVEYLHRPRKYKASQELWLVMNEFSMTYMMYDITRKSTLDQNFLRNIKMQCEHARKYLLKNSNLTQLFGKAREPILRQDKWTCGWCAGC